MTSNAVVAAINAAAPADELVVVGEPVAELTGTAKGFASDVTVTVSVDANNLITGVVINSAGETPNFGTRCGEDAAFAEQFIGKTIPVEAFDVLSGATVTSNAVVAAINAAAPAEEPADELVVVGEPVAELTGTAKGFASDVTVTVSVDENGVITGVVIDSANETQGFGTRCAEDEAFLAQFIGKTIPVEEFDALTGATVTSKAVVAAINATVSAEEPVVEVPATPAPEAEVLTAKAEGFMDYVVVNVTLNEDGTIATLAIDVSNELPPMCDLVLADEFINQFIGKRGPFVVGEGIDVASGATFSSNGAINALNSLFPAEEAAEEAAPAGDSLTGTAEGFQSDVTVTLTVSEGVITGIQVDSSNETPGFGTRCGEDEAFLAQFIGKKATPDLGEGIEALSGATVTSNAVVAAANAAIGVAEAVEIPAADEAVAAAPVTELTGTAKGFASDVTVTVSVDENGVITGVVIDSANETQGFGTRCAEDEAFLAQFIGKTIPVEEFDALTGATVTSKAVVAAINATVSAEEPVVEVPATPAPEAEVLTAKAEGFMDYVVVNVTLNEDGTIATLAIDVSNELPPMCDLVLADEFINQFIGKKGPFVVGEGIDVATGATFSSNGAINALNSLFPVQDMSVTGEEGPAAPAFVTKTAYDGKDITVTVTFAADGTVESLEVDASTQTPGLGKKCAEENFVSQFIGGTAPFVLGEGIDAVSYATVTSQAVVDAVNEAAGVAE